MHVGLIKDEKAKEEVPLADVKFTHSLCIGQTGSGKTSSFIYPNLLKRMELNHGILFFDIKGNEHLAIKTLAKQQGRLEGVIEIGKPWGKNINILKELNERKVNRLLKAIIGVKNAQGGQNIYFYNAAHKLGLNLYSIFRTIEILIQELYELAKIEYLFKDKKEFSLEDIYKASLDYDALYNFIQELKVYLENFEADTRELIKSSYSKNKQICGNIILNILQLKRYIDDLKQYDMEREDSNFQNSLASVISTLSDSFSFMINQSSRYITDTENTLNIVEELQNNKIIIINVRVIPDSILELLLEQVFEQLIDLNTKTSSIHPTSIFIDEAQRLINKDIPLDVLRSSCVDVLMAVQSELQLISKFKAREHWQQISVNIAQKYSFRSTILASENTFFPDTGSFETFYYTKAYENKIYKAKPIFLDKKKMKDIECFYQNKILKIKDIKKDEYCIYDVSHFEREREIIIENIKTNKKRFYKIFTDLENLMIKKYIKDSEDFLELIPF
ncbi:MAG: type IV secretory system conjugative DNA transfer family protein [Arcobacter sp.]|nr:type IV secretory system conjugative DNA transfer family protein [Arcobacter sp.]